MIVIVDTNIVFSAILNTKSLIGELILNSDNTISFQSCYFLCLEIEKNWNKLKKMSKLSESDLRESQRIIYNRIHFIDEGQIPKEHKKKAFELVKEIDLNDIVFVALNEFQRSILWTGDKVLATGLIRKGYDRVVSTSQLYNLLTDL
jgi:predicted nucleic acid-binding protein